MVTVELYCTSRNAFASFTPPSLLPSPRHLPSIAARAAILAFHVIKIVFFFFNGRQTRALVRSKNFLEEIEFVATN